MTDLSAVLRAAAQQHGVRPFLLGEGNPVTFGGLDALADRCAAGTSPSPSSRAANPSGPSSPKKTTDSRAGSRGANRAYSPR